jgi:hypothetical protein
VSGLGVGHVVLAGLAFHAVRADQVRRNQPCIQAHRAQLPGPVVRAAAGFHRHQAARRQLCAPRDKSVALGRLAYHLAAGRIHRVHLDHVLGQVNAYPDDRRT